MKWEFQIIIVVTFCLWVGDYGCAGDMNSLRDPTRIEIDIDHDEIPEILSLELLTNYTGEQMICRIEKNAEYITFEIDASDGARLRFNAITDWKVSDTEHILLFDMLHDYGAAGVSTENHLNFFLINTSLAVKKIGRFEGAYEQHHSASSGSHADITISFMNTDEERYFLITYRERFLELNSERSDCHGEEEYVRLTTTRIKLRYDSERKTLVKELLDHHCEAHCKSLE